MPYGTLGSERVKAVRVFSAEGSPRSRGVIVKGASLITLRAETSFPESLPSRAAPRNSLSTSAGRSVFSVSQGAR